MLSTSDRAGTLLHEFAVAAREELDNRDQPPTVAWGNFWEVGRALIDVHAIELSYAGELALRVRGLDEMPQPYMPLPAPTYIRSVHLGLGHTPAWAIPPFQRRAGGPASADCSA